MSESTETRGPKSKGTSPMSREQAAAAPKGSAKKVVEVEGDSLEGTVALFTFAKPRTVKRGKSLPGLRFETCQAIITGVDSRGAVTAKLCAPGGGTERVVTQASAAKDGEAKPSPVGTMKVVRATLEFFAEP